VAGDLTEGVDGHVSVGHPRQAGMPQAVALELLVAEPGDDRVPGGCTPKGGSGDPAASRAGEQPSLIEAGA
jgi:hypothetical protein